MSEPLDRAAWTDVGAADELAGQALHEVRVGGRTRIALSCVDGTFGAVSGVCNHVGGPLGQGSLDGEYVVCPWHSWKFHRLTGEGEPGFEQDAVPRHDVQVVAGRVWVRNEPGTRRRKAPHEPHPLARAVEREEGPLRLLGISTTMMDAARPRFSTSDALLDAALAHAAADGGETRLLRLRDLHVRPCEGYYSKSAHACTWPCSITQADPADQMEQVYEGLVHWADAVLVATPIRWGAASSLYFRMAERLNCVQNQVTLRDKVLIGNKTAGFIITGGQDNVQAVAGQCLMFFAELGFSFPQFPFIAHSRGWSAEDMERNVALVRESEALREAACELADRTLAAAAMLLAHAGRPEHVALAGRKAHRTAARHE